MYFLFRKFVCVWGDPLWLKGNLMYSTTVLVYLWKDSMTEANHLQIGFEFNVFFPLDWLLPFKARELSQPYYLTHSIGHKQENAGLNKVFDI